MSMPGISVIEQHPGRATRVIAVTGGKGGIGKTTVSINLAVALRRLRHDVLLLDADLGLANIDVLLGLTPNRNLQQVLDGDCLLDEVVIDGPAGIRILPAASGIRDMADLTSRQRAGLIGAFGTLETRADYMIVDTAAGIGANTVDFCAAAHEILVVVCDDPASLTDAYATIKVMSQEAGRNRFRVLVNMARDADSGLGIFRRLLEVTDRYLGVGLDYAGQIPWDAEVATCARHRRALIERRPHCGAGKAFNQLAATIDRWPAPAQPNGHVEFFMERMASRGDFARVSTS